MTLPLEMDVYMDKIEVEGQIIKRPEHITRSVWMRIWETIFYNRCPRCGRELD